MLPDSIVMADQLFDIKAATYISQEKVSYLEGQSGLRLTEGANLFLFETGRISLGEKAFLGLQLKQSFNDDAAINELYRGYFKIYFSKFSFEIGKDNINIGPGEYGLLVSNNTEPYPLIMFQTEEPLIFLGDWNFLLLKGWLLEDRDDVDDPEILALRLLWKPVSFFEVGATRSELYGGEGRPGYKLTEYPTLILGSKDNVPGKFDNDGYGGYDFTAYLPLEKLVPSVKEVKLYFENTGTDIKAFWQEEDKDKVSFPFFALTKHGLKYGLSISTNRDIIGIEHVITSEDTYRHHKYPVEGYTYQGLSLGYPYGNNVKSLFFKHKHNFTDSVYLEYKVGAYEQPVFINTGDRMRRYYASILGGWKIKDYDLEGFLRLDKTENYNSHAVPLPSQTGDIEDADKTFYILGVSIRYCFQ